MTNELAERSNFQMDMNQDQVQLLKDTVCRGATDDEFKLFLHVCKRTGLDPFARQIHSVPRRVWNEGKGTYDTVRSIQTGIDGFRTISERSYKISQSAKYGGEMGPLWCGADEIWKEVWISEEVPIAAKAAVVRYIELPNGQFAREEVWKTVHMERYVQTHKDKATGKQLPTKMWTGKSGVEQLGKCALAAAHRAAFPQDLSGVYLHEEMSHVEPAELEEKRIKVADSQEFVDKLPQAVKDRLMALGYDNQAKQRSLCNEAGNTLDGLELQMDACDFIEKMSPKLKDQVKFCGYKNRPDVRRLLTKVGKGLWDEEKLSAYLEGVPVEALGKEPIQEKLA